MEDKGLFKPRETWSQIVLAAVAFVLVFAGAYGIVWAGNLALEALKEIIQ